MDVGKIREQALEIVAQELGNEDIPPAKRADMALALLGKAAIKESDQSPEIEDTVEVWFNEIDEQGNRKRSFGYEFVPRRRAEE